jgi:hypothetical protein
MHKESLLRAEIQSRELRLSQRMAEMEIKLSGRIPERAIECRPKRQVDPAYITACEELLNALQRRIPEVKEKHWHGDRFLEFDEETNHVGSRV